MIVRLSAAAIGAMLLTGCATATMDGIMASWRGEHIDNVVKQWGYPSAERKFRGRTLYVWNNSGTYVIPSYSQTTGTVNRFGQFSASTTTHGSGTVTGVCERVLEVDDGGRVVATQWGGNNCCVATIAGECATWPNPRS